jgi:hypothetical protein
MVVAGNAAVGQVGGSGAGETTRNEPGAFDADVGSRGKAGPSDGSGVTALIDRDHAPALLVGRDQLTAVAPERRRRHHDPTLGPRPAARQRLDAPPAVHGEHLRGVPDGPGHQQAPTEAASGVERDALRRLAAG